MTGPGTAPPAGRAGWGRPLLAWRRANQRAHVVVSHHAGTRLVRFALGVRRRWLRSLQLRVVATTMLLGTIVVFAVG